MVVCCIGKLGASEARTGYMVALTTVLTGLVTCSNSLPVLGLLSTKQRPSYVTNCMRRDTWVPNPPLFKKIALRTRRAPKAAGYKHSPELATAGWSALCSRCWATPSRAADYHCIQLDAPGTHEAVLDIGVSSHIGLDFLLRTCTHTPLPQQEPVRF